jgi:hypothetical protein
MKNYDPEVDQTPTEWLATGEAERIAAVEAYHRRRRIRLPQPTLHAIMHTIVENQIALGEEVVSETLARLRSEGLTRHEAIHAIGMVLAEHIYHVLKNQAGQSPDMNQPYLDQLRQLTAEQWRQSGEAGD